MWHKLQEAKKASLREANFMGVGALLPGPVISGKFLAPQPEQSYPVSATFCGSRAASPMAVLKFPL
jgi:hypothetical protein